MTHRTSEAPLAVELTGPLSHALLALIGDQWCWEIGKDILCASSEIGPRNEALHTYFHFYCTEKVDHCREVSIFKLEEAERSSRSRVGMLVELVKPSHSSTRDNHLHNPNLVGHMVITIL